MLAIFTYAGAMLQCTRQETFQNFVRVREYVNTCKYLCWLTGIKKAEEDQEMH